MIRLSILLLLATSVFAQTANVIELQSTDTVMIQKAWDALQKAQTNWDYTRSLIAHKYLDDPTGGSCTITDWNGHAYDKWGSYCSKPGFINGFEFSKDFRFIVPKAAPVTPNPCGFSTSDVCVGGTPKNDDAIHIDPGIRR